MSRATGIVAEAAGRAVLRTASLLVPATERADWLREWRGELWQVRHCPRCGAGEAATYGPLQFCLGAVPDALALRRMARAERPHSAPLHRSASYCLLTLALALAGGWVVALRSPAVIAERHAERYSVNPGLVLIKDAAAGDWQASISIGHYRGWTGRRQQYFSGFAFYRIEHATIAAGAKRAELPIAHGSDTLLGLLGLPTELGSAAGYKEPAVVLSDTLWRGMFGADPAILGRMVQVGSRAVRVAAVLPDGAWRLPGTAEAWLVEPEAGIQAGGPGYVVARLKPSGWEMMWNDRINIQAFDGEGNEEDFWAISFRERTRGPWGIYCISILLAFLALPALTSVSLADAAVSAARPSRWRQAVRWGFLAAKLGLLAGIFYVAPLDIVYAGQPGYSPGAAALHLILTVTMSLFGLWWAVADQRKRCPVCLRRVTHPARVGIASRTFLAWNGTELMCTGGHTLLEVPALPTSWFGEPRWVYLDASWDFLFAA